MKRTKKILLFVTTMLITFLSINTVYAEGETCTTYKYYFPFYLIHHETHYNDAFGENGPGYIKFANKTEFELGNDKDLSNPSKIIKREGIVCLKRSKNDTENCTTDVINKHTDSAHKKYMEVMTLEKFYNAINGKATLTEAGKTIRIHKHGSWVEIDDNDEATSTPSTSEVDFEAIDTDDLVKGSHLPDYSNDYSKITMKSNYSVGTIRRYVAKNKNGNSGVTPFEVAWGNADPSASILTPGMYYVEFDICTYTGTINYYYYKDKEGKTKERIKNDKGKTVPAHEESELEPGYENPVNSPKITGCYIVDTKGNKITSDDIVNVKIDKTNPKNFEKDVYYYCPKYTATINYYYYKDGETTDSVKDDNGETVPAHKESNLDPGYENPVPSPKITGCYIVDTKGNKIKSDDTVNVKIDKTNPKNFKKNVYYYCPIENEPEQEPTGSALIYIAWIIGLGALGYSAYYFINLYKEKKQEI